jgi:hypothetical protein
MSVFVSLILYKILATKKGRQLIYVFSPFVVLSGIRDNHPGSVSLLLPLGDYHLAEPKQTQFKIIWFTSQGRQDFKFL